jgi:hypothetical protein
MLRTASGAEIVRVLGRAAGVVYCVVRYPDQRTDHVAHLLECMVYKGAAQASDFDLMFSEMLGGF